MIITVSNKHTLQHDTMAGPNTARARTHEQQYSVNIFLNFGIDQFLKNEMVCPLSEDYIQK